jgi:hypothetical protein
MSLSELDYATKELGYLDLMRYYYRAIGEKKMHFVMPDFDALELAKIGRIYTPVNIFFKYPNILVFYQHLSQVLSLKLVGLKERQSE